MRWGEAELRGGEAECQVTWLGVAERGLSFDSDCSYSPRPILCKQCRENTNITIGRVQDYW